MSVSTTRAAANTSSPLPSRGPSRAWLVVGLLAVFTFLNFADKAVVGLAGVEMIKDLGITKQQFGLVQSSFFWLYAVGAIVGGMLVGRVPARWLLAGTSLLWVIALLPMVWSTSYEVLIATRILLGFAEGPTAAMALAVAHSWFTAEKRALPSSIVVAGTSIGPVVAAPVITALVLHHSWHAAFLVAALAGLCWVALWVLFGKEGNEKDTTEPAESPVAGTPLPEHVPYRLLLTSGTVLGLCVLFFVSYSSTALKVSWLPLYLRDGLGYDATTAGNLITLPYIATAIMIVAAGFVSRMLTKRGVSNRWARGGLATGLIVAGGLSTVVFSMLDRGPLQIALIAVGASMVAASNGVAWTTVSDVAPPKQRGTIFAVVIAVYSIGGILAPLVLGKLVEDAGSAPLEGYSRGFLGLGIMLVVGAVIAFFLINPERDVRRFTGRTAPVPVASEP